VGGTASGGTTISGTVTTPGGAISKLQGKRFEFVSLIVSNAYAAITGLTPVVGAKVDLIRINNAGVPVGGVLATATTDANGKYSLVLPASVVFSADLVVRVKGVASQEIRAVVTGTVVDISPVTEFVLQEVIKKIASNTSASLSVNVTPDEVVALVGLVNSNNVNLTSASTIADAVGSLSGVATVGVNNALIVLIAPGTQTIPGTTPPTLTAIAITPINPSVVAGLTSNSRRLGHSLTTALQI